MGATVKSTPQSRPLDSTGPATALSTISNTLDKVGSLFEKLNGVTLPKPNVLFDYASYTYSLGLGVLSTEYYNKPDATYMVGQQVPLICKSAGAEPSNRINTLYGQFDFFMDNLHIDCYIGRGYTGNVYKIEFEVKEPYSFGLFMVSIEQAALEAGYKNWRDAPFLLTIDFKGNTETGDIRNIPGTSRKIAIKFISIDISVTASGSTYKCQAYKANDVAFTTEHGTVKTDVSIKGATVQEVLQTGEKSLQKVLNDRLQQFKKAKIINVPDEIIILFPTDVSSAGISSGIKGSATTSTANDIHTMLKLTKSERNQTFVQTEGECNELGRASMKFTVSKKGDTPVGKEDIVYDPKTQVWTRGNNTIDFKQGDFRFGQGQTIQSIIEQILLQSEYPTKALDPGAVSAAGRRDWWTIQAQSYDISSDETYTSLGRKPVIHVYRVVPYGVHTSKLAPPGVKVAGFGELVKSAPKEYNYIYSGKNVDVRKFDINYGVSFTQLMAADTNNATQGAKLKSRKSGAKVDEAAVHGLQPNSGNKPDGKSGTSKASYSFIDSILNRLGGGGIRDAAVQAAMIFHNAVITNYDMINLEMEILGDPDWIVQSGTGNYVSKPSNFININADGTINWQNGEVDVIVNFKTPIDINQDTGLYDFGKTSAVVPIAQFCGAYCIISVTSRFTNGLFTQTLTGYRKPGYELTSEEVSPAKLFSATLSEITSLIKGFFDIF